MTASGDGVSFRDNANVLGSFSSDGLHSSVNTLKAVDLYKVYISIKCEK